MQATLQVYLEFLHGMSYSRIFYDANQDCYRLDQSMGFYMKYSVLQTFLFCCAYYSIKEWHVMFYLTTFITIDFILHLTAAVEALSLMMQLIWSLIQQYRLLNLIRRLQKLSKNCGDLKDPRWMLRCWMVFNLMYPLNTVLQYGFLILSDSSCILLLANSIVHHFYCNYLMTFLAVLLNLMTQILRKYRKGLESALDEGQPMEHIQKIALRYIKVHDQILFLAEQHVSFIYGPLIILHLTYATLALTSILYYLS
ncbi:hypothetical protein KR093_001684, partial [Drosophila rubida]